MEFVNTSNVVTSNYAILATMPTSNYEDIKDILIYVNKMCFFVNFFHFKSIIWVTRLYFQSHHIFQYYNIIENDRTYFSFYYDTQNVWLMQLPGKHVT